MGAYPIEPGREHLPDWDPADIWLLMCLVSQRFGQMAAGMKTLMR